MNGGMHINEVRMASKRILINFIRDHMISYAAGILILIATSFVAMTIPKILGTITDGLNNGDMPAQEVWKNVFAMVLLTILAFLMKFAWRYFLIGNCRTLECYLRDKLFKHLQTLPLSFYNDHKTGDLVAHAINDVQAIRFTFGFGSIQLLDGIIACVISICYMAGTINPTLTAMALAPVPIAVFVMVWLGKLIRMRFRRRLPQSPRRFRKAFRA